MHNKEQCNGHLHACMNYSYLYPCMVSMYENLFTWCAHTTDWLWLIYQCRVLYILCGWTKTWSARTLIKQATLAKALPS